MLLTLENTQDLTSYEFIEQFSIELWEDENIYLLVDPKLSTIPNFFYLTAYFLEFDTQFQMSGLVTLLSNSSTYNFENTLNGFREIGSETLYNCLQGILDTLHKYGMTPVKMRERFINGTKGLMEHSIITVGQFFEEDNLLEELRIYDNELSEIHPLIWTDLETYLIKIRGK